MLKTYKKKLQSECKDMHPLTLTHIHCRMTTVPESTVQLLLFCSRTAQGLRQPPGAPPGRQRPGEERRPAFVHHVRHVQGHDGRREAPSQEARRGQSRRQEGTASDEGDRSRQSEPLHRRLHRPAQHLYRHAVLLARQPQGGWARSVGVAGCTSGGMLYFRVRNVLNAYVKPG